MFKIPELAMPKTQNVTTVCNGKREVWEDREEAKDFFLRQMMITEARNVNAMNVFIFNSYMG